MIQENSKTKRKDVVADSYARVAESCEKGKSGRGSVAGWTNCPLCGRHSRKKFALGRGIASHLHAVHTPWKPGKVERKKRRREEEERRGRITSSNKKRKLEKAAATESTSSSATVETTTPKTTEAKTVGTTATTTTTKEPTPEQVEDWNQQVLKIVKDLEDRALEHKNNDGGNENNIDNGGKAGCDRNGQPSKSYRDSLPPFLQAAADGDLDRLKQFVANARQSSSEGKSNGSNTSKSEDIENGKHNCAGVSNRAVCDLINSTDRHLSKAEHWAAGGGHLSCLKYILDLRQQYEQDDSSSATVANIDGDDNVVAKAKKKVRRRDGKTCLHYAARNGQLNCINYLVQEQGHAVDESSGDGTTPLHLACFGGYLEAIKLLITKHGANVHATNDWDCNAAHWIGMTRCESAATVADICRLLQSVGVSLVHKQKQGHTILHKAAQRKNEHVIRWLAQSADKGGAGLSPEQRQTLCEPDGGGHTPSSIWRSVGGDEAVAEWMEKEMGG